MSPAPPWLPLTMDGVPSALRALPWVGFRGELRDDGHWRKVPFQIASPREHASNTAPAHWRNEGDVREVQVMAPGLFHAFGVVLSAAAGLTFIDLDDVRDPDTAAIEAWALAMVERFDSWAEISVSGTGVHIFVRGTLPGSGLSNYLDGDPTRKVEVYSVGRFACLTGRPLEPVRPLAERQRLVTLLAQYVRPPGSSAAPSSTPPRDDGPIPAGQRNDALFRIARGFVLHGLRGRDLEQALLAVSRRRCVPVPPDADVIKIARHADVSGDRGGVIAPRRRCATTPSRGHVA